MTRRIIVLIWLLLATVPLMAQVASRDYAVTALTYDVTADATTLILTIDVRNQGGTFDLNAPLAVTVQRGTIDPILLLSDAIPPLAANEAQTFTYELPLSDFQVGDALQVSVGVDGFELAGTQLSQNNIATITLDDLNPTLEGAASENSLSLPFALDNIETIFAFEDEQVIVLDNAFTREEFALRVALGGGAILALWLLSLLLRLIFRRPPRFDAWQPPYGMVSALDSDSVSGRRQAWQQHAQNGLIMAAPTEGNVHVVKVLLGADGREMGDWKIKAMRLSQYDNYGRITRSQTIAQKRWVKRLNGILRKSAQLDTHRLERRVRPVAKKYAKAFKKKINRKNAFLPISLDIRFEGKHGEVRIMFDLYQFGRGSWHRIDQWEPAMMLTSGRLQENYTYTVHGQRNGETIREFRRRLQDDICWLLMETLRTSQPQQQAEVPQETLFSVPDTLTGMEPIVEHPAT